MPRRRAPRRGPPSRLAAGAGLLAAAALASALLAPQLATGAGSGGFSPTGSMGAARYRPAAAPLPAGRVLVAGGYYYDGADHNLSTAEVYSPATNAWTAVDAMGTARWRAAAAPLPDGRVLVAGGSNNGLLASAEAYNPATDTWAPIASMGIARQGHAAALLPHGRVLVVGGSAGASAEAYNPATNAWSPVTPMGTARFAPAAAPLPDGRVLVAGGIDGVSVLPTAEVYDPATNTWTAVGAMDAARYAAAAAPLPDGRVLVAGGYYFDGTEDYLGSAETFDPATNAWTPVGAMGTPRVGAAAGPLADGRVLVAGGETDGSTSLASVEIFAASNAFSFRVKRRRLIVSVQASGKVSVGGAASRHGAAAAKKKKRRLLKRSSAAGDPPRISVPLRLSKFAKERLRRKGKVKVRARITFVPLGGLANTQTTRLKIRSRGK